MPKITVPEGARFFGHDPEAGKHRFFLPGETVEVSKAQAEKIGAIVEKADAPPAPAKVAVAKKK